IIWCFLGTRVIVCPAARISVKWSLSQIAGFCYGKDDVELGKIAIREADCPFTDCHVIAGMQYHG
ncbi:hypothetical protein, partial [Thiolapillus sp.]|uniref:hypothetical protein n=1 Tax=Thiolapillus sp. TaxID=2017437 RepID=UPI003AF71AF8